MSDLSPATTVAVSPENAILPAPAGSPAAAPDTSMLGLAEALLKDPRSVDATLADGHASTELVTRFLAITLAGFTTFGLVLAAMLDLTGAGPRWLPPVRWGDGSALWPILAYDFSVIAACGVCLPSFYFYNLLAGVRLSMIDVVAHATKCLARSAIVLIGFLPIWVALALGQHMFECSAGTVATGMALGLLLPFLAGLFGVASLYRGFALVAERQRQRHDGAVIRFAFLTRLLLAWAGIWTTITPVMIYTVWTSLAGHPGMAALISDGR